MKSGKCDRNGFVDLFTLFPLATQRSGDGERMFGYGKPCCLAFLGYLMVGAFCRTGTQKQQHEVAGFGKFCFLLVDSGNVSFFFSTFYLLFQTVLF